jgi:hypothetical protein
MHYNHGTMAAIKIGKHFVHYVFGGYKEEEGVKININVMIIPF